VWWWVCEIVIHNAGFAGHTKLTISFCLFFSSATVGTYIKTSVFMYTWDLLNYGDHDMNCVWGWQFNFPNSYDFENCFSNGHFKCSSAKSVPTLSCKQLYKNGSGGNTSVHSCQLLDSSWCLCGKWQAMPTPAESLCCREIDGITELLNESCQLCLRQCDEFESVCLNADVLVTVAGLLCVQQAGKSNV
jgi:hypothetical protein